MRGDGRWADVLAQEDASRDRAAQSSKSEQKKKKNIQGCQGSGSLAQGLSRLVSADKNEEELPAELKNLVLKAEKKGPEEDRERA
eukprot:13576453-Alexandrium_andersonii.AAC.1